MSQDIFDAFSRTIEILLAGFAWLDLPWIEQMRRDIVMSVSFDCGLN
jgi:hypothetical protein